MFHLTDHSKSACKIFARNIFVAFTWPFFATRQFSHEIKVAQQNASKKFARKKKRNDGKLQILNYPISHMF